FLPKNKKRSEFIKNVENVTTTLVFYISPHSVNDDIKDLYKVLGSRNGVLIKEMTKIYEKAIDITLSDTLELELKGEMVLVLEGKKTSQGDCLQLSPMEHLMGYINSGMSKNDAIKLVAKTRNVPKNEIYKLLNNDEQE
ncbi:MAG: 16S rRNA (cytidine(1402)-2'-O)-methyltransferase, partial [Clostridia bacterium]